mgnify:CR=1 FL=1
MKTRRMHPALLTGLTVLLLAACSRQSDKAPSTYQTVPVEKRDIIVAVEAAGLIEPSVTVELKSKASGQILEIHALLDNARGRFLATRIELEDNANEFRLRGLISALDTTAKTFMLREISVSYAGVTEYKDGSEANLADGRAVEVKGRWTDDRTTLAAARIEFE